MTKYLILSIALLCSGFSTLADPPAVLPELAPAQPEPVPAQPEPAIAPAKEPALIPTESAVEPLAADLAIPEPLDLITPTSALPTLMVDNFVVNKDAQLGSVLRALARIANVNIAFGDSVEMLGPFRFRLNNPTPWNEVLESILDVYHLSYEVRGTLITIMTIEDMELRYNLEKQKNNHIDLKLQQEAMTPLSLKVITIKYVKAESLVDPITKILQQSAREKGSEMRSSISFDKANNNIILNASESETEKITALVKLADRRARQVRIEATLVEVSSKFASELGARWAVHANKSIDGSSETREAATLTPMTQNPLGLYQLSEPTYHTAQGTVNAAEGAINFGVISEDFALGMNLKALAEDGKIKILSRPSLTTLDNQPAIIKSGSDIPFRTEDDDGNPVVEYKEAVLSLNVLPHVVDDAAIFMDVEIKKDEPDFSQSVDGNPLVIKKYVQTRLMVLDGQTAVIGGLTKTSQANRNGGIPYLRKIPIIGFLFSSKQKEKGDEELIIFLTPRIVPEEIGDTEKMIEEWMTQHYPEAKTLQDKEGK